MLFATAISPCRTSYFRAMPPSVSPDLTVCFTTSVPVEMTGVVLRGSVILGIDPALLAVRDDIIDEEFSTSVPGEGSRSTGVNWRP